MPQSILNGPRVQAMLPHPLPPGHLEEILFQSKAELSRVDGDAWTIEVTPDRLDLLSEGGLGAYLQGATGVAHGLVPVGTPSHPRDVRFEVDGSVEPLRPF